MEEVLQRRRKPPLLQHEQLRGLTLHAEPVGVAVELHRTHEVLEPRDEVGQLRGGGGRFITKTLNQSNRTFKQVIEI